jgi:hypothetical protein
MGSESQENGTKKERFALQPLSPACHWVVDRIHAPATRRLAFPAGLSHDSVWSCRWLAACRVPRVSSDCFGRRHVPRQGWCRAGLRLNLSLVTSLISLFLDFEVIASILIVSNLFVSILILPFLI